MTDVRIKLVFDDGQALQRMASFDQTQARTLQSAAANTRLLAKANLDAAKAETLNARAVLESSRSAQILATARLVQARAAKTATTATQEESAATVANARITLQDSKALLDAEKAALNNAKARKAAADALRTEAAATKTATAATQNQTDADKKAADAAAKKTVAEKAAADRKQVTGENRQWRDENFAIRQQISGMRELEKAQERVFQRRTELARRGVGELPLVSALPQGIAGSGVLGAGGGIAMGLAASAAEAIRFQKIMTEMRNNTVLTDDEFTQFTGDIKQLGLDTGASMDKIADGFRKVKDYGFSAAEAFKIVTEATHAAVATGNDADTTSALLAETMHIFKLGADQASAAMNTLYEAALLGRSTLKDFVEQSGQAMAIGAGLGASLQDVATIMSALSRNGLDLAEASTQYKDALIHIEGPTTAVTARLQTLQDQYNKTHQDQLHLVDDFSRYGVQTKGLTGIIQDLSKAYEGHTENIKQVIPALRGFVGTAILAQNGLSDMEQAQKALDDTMAGRSTPLLEAYGRAHETIDNKIARVKNEVLVLAVNLGDKLIPIIGRAADGLEHLGQAFNSLSPDAQNVIVHLAVLASGSLLFIGSMGKAALGLRALREMLGEASLGLKTEADASVAASGGTAEVGAAAAAATPEVKALGVAATTTAGQLETMGGAEAAQGIAGVGTAGEAAALGVAKVGTAAEAAEGAQASLITAATEGFATGGPYLAALALAAAGVYAIYDNYRKAKIEHDHLLAAGYANVLNSPDQQVQDHKDAAGKIIATDLPNAKSSVTQAQAALDKLTNGGWQKYDNYDGMQVSPKDRIAGYENAVQEARAALGQALRDKDTLSTKLSNLQGRPSDVTYKDVLESARRSGDVHPEVTAAQFVLESGNGKHTSGAFNYFGMKAAPYEPGTDKATTEVVNGKTVHTTARFRDFASLDDAVGAHAQLLRADRYHKAGYDTAKTPEDAAKALQTAGYATDPNYAASLIKIIRQHTTPLAGPPGSTPEDPGKAAKDNAAVLVAKAGLGSETAKVAYEKAKEAFDQNQTALNAATAERLRRAQLAADLGEKKKDLAAKNLDSPDRAKANQYDFQKDAMNLTADADADIRAIEEKVKGSKEELAKTKRDLDLAVQQRQVAAADVGVSRLERMTEKSTDPGLLNSLSGAYVSQANTKTHLLRTGLTDSLAELPDNPANKDKRAAEIEKERTAELQIQVALAQKLADLDARRLAAVQQNLQTMKAQNEAQTQLTQAQLEAAKTDETKAALRAQLHALRLQDLDLEHQSALNDAHAQFDPLILQAKTPDERAALTGERDKQTRQADDKYQIAFQTENTAFGAQDMTALNEQTRIRADRLRTEAGLTDDLALKMQKLAQATALMLGITPNPDDQALIRQQGQREQHTLQRDVDSQNAQTTIAQGILQTLPGLITQGLDAMKTLGSDPDATKDERKSGRADYMKQLVDLVEDHRLNGTDALQRLNSPDLRAEMTPTELAAATGSARQILDSMLKDDFLRISAEKNPDLRKHDLERLQTDVATNPLYKSLGINGTGVDAVKQEIAKNPKGLTGNTGEFFNDFAQESSRFASTFIHDLLNPKDRKNIMRDFWTTLEDAGEGALSNVLQKQLQNGLQNIFNSAFGSMFGGGTKNPSAGNTAVNIAGQVATQAAGNAAGQAAGNAAGAAAGAAGTAAAGSAAGAGATAAGGAFSSMSTVAPYLAAVAVLSNPQVEKAITDYISTAAKAVATVVDSLGKLAAGVITAYGTAIATVTKAAGQAIESVGKGVGSAVDGIGSGIGKAASGIGDGIGKVIGSITGGNAMRVATMNVAQMNHATVIQGGAGGGMGGGSLGGTIGAAFGGPVGGVIGSVVGSLFHFAKGGRYPKGREILVGEEGPEIVKIDQGGTIVNAMDTKHALDGMAGSTAIESKGFNPAVQRAVGLPDFQPSAPSSLRAAVAGVSQHQANQSAGGIRELIDAIKNMDLPQGDQNINIHGPIHKDADLERVLVKSARRNNLKRRGFTRPPGS